MKWNFTKSAIGVALGCLLASTLHASEPVDLNADDVQTIADNLDGIGPVKARAIIEFREQIGRFGSVEQLLEVDGIGEKLFMQIKPYLNLGALSEAGHEGQMISANGKRLQGSSSSSLQGSAEAEQ